MDQDADRHGEEEQGRNKKIREPRGLLSDKRVQLWSWNTPTSSFVVFFLTSSPPDVLLRPLGYTGTSGEAVY